jgi:glycerol-3-phosphate O-acyltransferase
MGVGRVAIWLARKPLALWVRFRVRPEDAAQRLRGRGRPICYVLERQSLSDLLVLQEACVAQGLPRPSRRLRIDGERPRSVCYLERRLGWIRTRVDRRPPRLLGELLAAAAGNAGFDVDIVPVAIFWGRAPQKEGSWLRLMLAENWALAGRFRKFLTVLFNGRHTLVQFGEPLQLQVALAEGLEHSRAVRRVARTLRGQLRMQRSATIGPDLSHRRTIVAQVLATRAVRVAVAQEMKDKNLSRREALLVAKRYVDEIAANYSHAFVTFMERLLARLWNRLYDGVELHHLDTLQQVAEGNELVYVPCHRSHMDYLLLSYIIYVKGYAVPHIAGGVNLNLPVIGRFLRKGGTFFLRRTFRGNALYPVVFMKYLGLMMARGHSLEYFIEGGRSRTGRLLRPKTGMLSMTVRSHLRDPRRPVVFLPVYFGYERLVEGDTYIDELRGRAKKKETVWGLLKTLPQLRRKFGKVHVSLGAPLALNDLLRKHDGGELDARAVSAVVDELARGIMININAAAVVTPVNLLAVALLATPRQAMLEGDLVRQLDLYLGLLQAAPYSDRITLARLGGSAMDGAAIVRHAEGMRLVQRRSHPSGDILRMDEHNAVLLTYFRNNVLHLFSMPSLLACCFVGNAVMRTADLHRLAWRIYPYIADELFLRWREDELAQVVSAILGVFAERGLLEYSAEAGVWRRPPPTVPQAMQLSVLAQGTIQVVERYYLVVALLIQAGSNMISQEALVSRCHLTAQRMATLYGLSAPEFFDRTLFDSFIRLLRERGVIQVSPDNRLTFNEVLLKVAGDAQVVLSEQIRHSILQVAHS